jgi:hypothetical protein
MPDGVEVRARGDVDLARLEIELDVAGVAAGQPGLVARAGRQRDRVTAERTCDGQDQVVGSRLAGRFGQQPEAEAADGAQGLSGRAGDGALQLLPGHGVGLQEGVRATATGSDPGPLWPERGLGSWLGDLIPMDRA